MPNLLSCKNLDKHPSVRVQVIENDDGTKWVRLSNTNVRQSFGVWSRKQDSKGDTVDFLLTELAGKLDTASDDNDKNLMREALSGSSNGWDYWSLGLPGPISNYLLFEFFDDVNYCYSRQAVDSFLSSFRNSGGTQKPFGLTLELIMSLKLPSEEVYGLALMAAIEYSAIVFANGDDLQPFDPSELSTIASLTFSCVNEKESWWKSHYANCILDGEVTKKAKVILKKIEKLDLVKSVQVFLP